ncbi:MAG TPA: sigma-70 family RNA polymerase sigma factor, partial [Gaiellaceae bacterium]|nr:sigma-70 family RNA polymerase sigma factor [Gaiellaceae bacterium]
MATAPPAADRVLARRLHERDRTAWEELYGEYGPRLRPFAYRLTGNPHDADDLVQETFVRALPRLDRLDPESVELGPYLFTTLRNLFLKSVERGRRAEPVAEVPEPASPAPIDDDPERSTLLHRQQEEVRVANARLAPRQRLVLALRELEDRSYAEIGEVVGLNENAVAQLISRARDNLRTELRLAQVDPSRLPEECRRLLPLLSRHLDGQLRGAQVEPTLAHLDGCERCQAALVAMQEAQRRYRTLFPLLAGAEELWRRIDDALAATGYWSGPRRSRLRLRGRHALVAATVAVLMGGGGVAAAVVTRGGPVPVAQPASVSRTSSPATTTAAARPSARQPTTTVSPPRTTRAAATTAARRPHPSPAARRAQPPTPTTSSTAVATTTATTAAVAPAPPPKIAVVPAPTKTALPTVEPPTPKQPKPAPLPKPAPTPPATTAPTTTVAPPVDRTAPSVTILARPPAETTSGDASYSFRASETGSTFSCRLDGAEFAPCSSPTAHRDLLPGPHSFAVRARDAAGNTGRAAAAGWIVLPPPDTTAPTVAIVASTRGSAASFALTASESGSAFSCSLDGGAFETCGSPRVYSGLTPGGHTFAVRATDPAGNTGPSATH